ncbi:conserved virulence factor C family protein [Gorillibacterium timonense]|uniref:conserved virulence factor C family protein n=1 Tax=Gorillibacterium timonense TaxID=1689269 RepID=UPI00071E030C|nr:conserved virulence factor C family protein [Gorillibacterium timonense]
MKLISIEPTPSPNSMKLNLDETLPAGDRRTYTPDTLEQAPEEVRKLFTIPGVTGLYHAADFMAIDRHPKSDWQPILRQVRAIMGEAPNTGDSSRGGTILLDTDHQVVGPSDSWGEVRVAVQYFRGIPMQIRVYSGEREERLGLPGRFAEAAIQAGLASPNLIKERKLEEHGVRYGELQDVLGEVSAELDAAYSEERLAHLVASAGELAPGETPMEGKSSLPVSDDVWSNPDWRIRYAALERIKPQEESIPFLRKALQDEKVSIRRLAAVYLGDVRTPEAMQLLYSALQDPSPIVRRTVGDTLSDIGDPEAAVPMAAALRDRNKLVRWRAARFLYEAGDERSLPALRAAENDAEFEIRMQIQMAIQRIEGGEAAAGSVWQQMTGRERN